MPNLYGSSGLSGDSGMYGRVNDVLSERNQAQAQQLKLPDAVQQPGEAGGAGSQQAAQDDWANFEDIFNKNRGYTAKALDSTKKQVTDALGDVGKPQNMGMTHSQNPNVAVAAQAPRVQTSQAAPDTVNPSAPPQLQAGSIAGIQQKSDLLTGYGNSVNSIQQAPSSYSGLHGGNMLKTPPASPTPSQPSDATPPPAPQKDGIVDPNDPDDPDNPFNYHAGDPSPGNPAQTQDTGAPNQDSQNPHAAMDLNGDGVVSDFEKNQYLKGTGTYANGTATPAPSALGAPANGAPGTGVDPALQAKADEADKAAAGPDGTPTAEDMKTADAYSKSLGLLNAWGNDDGQALLQQQNPEAGAWDAAMMAAGGGRAAQQQMSKDIGGAAKSWADSTYQRLAQESADKKASGEQASIFHDLLNQQKGAAPGAKPGAPSAKPGTPGTNNSHKSYKSIDEFMAGDAANGMGTGDTSSKTLIHEIGQQLDPVSMAEISAGENGVDMGNTVSEIFRNMFAGRFSGDVSELNNRVALGLIQQKWGDDAARWLWDNLTPEMWDSFNNHNYGYVEWQMKQILGQATNPDGSPRFHEGWQPGDERKPIALEDTIGPGYK